MATLAASIMAHPVRSDLVAELTAQLDREIPIAWDGEGPPSSNRQRRWRTGRRAWELAYDAGAEWSAVLQDDVVVCRDLLAGLEVALDHVPDDGKLVQPYVGTKRPQPMLVLKAAKEARRQWNTRWIRMRSLWWGVLIVVPTETVPAMLAWCDERVNMPYDMRVGRYYRDVFGWPTWYTWPSLVDHRRGPSLIVHSDGGRHAFEFHDGSALDIDWANGDAIGSNEPLANTAKGASAERRAARLGWTKTTMKRAVGEPLKPTMG